jgi:hypothetical protein
MEHRTLATQMQCRERASLQRTNDHAMLKALRAVYQGDIQQQGPCGAEMHKRRTEATCASIPVQISRHIPGEEFAPAVLAFCCVASTMKSP